jgi:16S rRNA (guanine527-N7)-methyltransferase
VTAELGINVSLRARAAAAGVALKPLDLERFERFYNLLDQWNARINLTALRLGPTPPDDTVDRLFIECVVASTLVAAGPQTLVDFGSGAGSPALPLAIVCPALRAVLVESRGRKAAFLREGVRVLDLTARVNVVQARFQELPADTKADIVSVRALRIDKELLATAARVLRPSGRLMLFGTAEAPPGWPAQLQRNLPGGSTVLICGRGAAASV